MNTNPIGLKDRAPRIGVLGPHVCTEAEYALGLRVGRALAEGGARVLCGGLEGMMQAVAEGAQKAGGQTIGLLPGDKAEAANPYIDLALPTGLGAFRNVLLARACNAVIAVHGKYGTLLEIAAALRLGVPVVGLQTWELRREDEVDPGIHPATDPEAAAALAIRLAHTKK